MKSRKIVLVVGILGLVILVLLGSQQPSNAVQSENSATIVEKNNTSGTNNSQDQESDSATQDSTFVVAPDESNTSEVDVYLKKAESFWNIDQYEQAIDIYKQCYMETGERRCIDTFRNYVVDSFNEFVSIRKAYFSKIERVFEEKKREKHLEVSRGWAFPYEPIFPDATPLYKKQYSLKNDELTNAKFWIKVFNNFKLMYNNLYALYTLYVKNSLNNSSIDTAIKEIDDLERIIKPAISKYYNDIVGYGFVRYMLFGVWNTLAVAKEEASFSISSALQSSILAGLLLTIDTLDTFGGRTANFSDTDTTILRKAAQMLARLDAKLVKTCDEETRNFYVKVVTQFKKDANEQLLEEFRLVCTFADNINEGRTGTELWWSE